MKIFKILILICIILLSVNTCNALTLGQDVSYLEFYEGSSLHIADKMIYDYQEDRIIYVDSTNSEIREFTPSFPTDTASTSILIYGLTNPSGISLTMDNNIVFGDTSGNVYIVNDFSGMLNFSDSSYDDYFLLVTTIDSGVHDINVDANNNIYVSGENEKIWKISQPYYATGQLSAVPVTTYGATNLEIIESGFMASYVGSNLNKVQEYDISSQTIGTEHFSSSCGFNYEPPSTIMLNNGNFIVRTNLYASSSDKRAIITHVNTTDSTEFEIARYVSSGLSDAYYTDLCIDKNGLLYASMTGGGWQCFVIENSELEISSFLYNNIYTGSGGTSISTTFDYINKDIDSLYSTYYNNSDITIGYNIKTDYLGYSSTDDNDLSDQFINDYSFRIELINPSGISETSKSIDASELKQTTHTITTSFYGIPIITGKAHQYSISGTNIFYNSNNWINGTWTVKLYEVNANTTTHTLLDSDTLEIMNTQSDTNIIIDNTQDSIDGTQLATNIFNSPYFYALVIIMSVASTGAYFAQGIGFLGGATIGVFISGGFGLIPMWLILTLIIVFIVLFALIGGKSIGGGD